MLISKNSYRLSISGGSCDYQSYFSEYGPVILVGAALNLYCYVSINKITPLDNICYQIFYSSVEKIFEDDIEQIKNPGVRGTLKFLKKIYPDLKNISIYISNEVPHLSGLGTSSSLILGILKCVHEFYGYNIGPQELAEQAILVERSPDYIGETGGIQDAIWGAFGGVNSLIIQKSGDFTVRPLPVSEDFLNEFKESAALFFLGKRRSYQVCKTSNNTDSLNYKRNIAAISHEVYKEFCSENIKGIGNLIHNSWQEKKKISNLISTKEIDSLYESLFKIGIYGGRILGSGGGGCLFCIFPKEKRTEILSSTNLPVIPIDFNFSGSEIIFKK